MRKWRDIERQMAPRSQTFSQGGIRSRDWFSDRLFRRGSTDGDSFIPFALHFFRANYHLLRPLIVLGGTYCIYLLRALHISMVTSTDRAMVIG